MPAATATLPAEDAANAGECSSQLVEFVRRGKSLYTLPAVAVEVLQLTESPQVDAHALKDCIQRDPALTAKVLRVVNSSLFGLSRGVDDLNQAVALLGVKPLKLLVLGFSLPERLFLGVASEELQWYWRTTLARAVAAREISEQVFNQAGDDAFLAGLLQGIGILALLGELGESYSQFIQQVIAEQGDLSAIERDALGFDHRQLTAGLLAEWRLPQTLIDAIRQPRIVAVLARGTDKPHRFRQSVHLADLLSQLVAQKRLKALPQLLEAGRAYCDMDRDLLTTLVVNLQERVNGLADVLSVSLDDETSYLETMAEGHERLSELSEEFSQQLGLSETTPARGAAELASSVALLQAAASIHDPSSPAPQLQQQAQSPPNLPKNFDERLILTLGLCRRERQPLSVAWFAVETKSRLTPSRCALIEQVLDAIGRKRPAEENVYESTEPQTRVLLLPNCERHEAIGVANDLLRQLHSVLDRLETQHKLPRMMASAGVSTVVQASKNFHPDALLETARRCQQAGLAAGGVKSLEIC